MLAEASGPSDGAAAGSRRERAKAARRARIVAATCELLREVGIDELSMKGVAVRAGVSLSTVYNLFESKQAVLARVFEEDLERFEARVAAAPSADALGRIFDALDVAADVYAADPAFYRATMWRRPGGGGELKLETTVRAPRIRFWRVMAARAADEGWLRRGTNPDVVAALLIQIAGGVLGDWIAGDIGIETLRREMKLGFAATLLAFASGESAGRLRRLVDETHAALKAGC